MPLEWPTITCDYLFCTYLPLTTVHQNNTISVGGGFLLCPTNHLGYRATLPLRQRLSTPLLSTSTQRLLHQQTTSPQVQAKP